MLVSHGTTLWKKPHSHDVNPDSQCFSFSRPHHHVLDSQEEGQVHSLCGVWRVKCSKSIHLGAAHGQVGYYIFHTVSTTDPWSREWENVYAICHLVSSDTILIVVVH